MRVKVEDRVVVLEVTLPERGYWMDGDIAVSTQPLKGGWDQEFTWDPIKVAPGVVIRMDQVGTVPGLAVRVIGMYYENFAFYLADRQKREFGDHLELFCFIGENFTVGGETVYWVVR